MLLLFTGQLSRNYKTTVWLRQYNPTQPDHLYTDKSNNNIILCDIYWLFVFRKQDPTTWGHRKSHTTTPPAGACSGPSWAPTTPHGPATSPSTTTRNTRPTGSTHPDTVTCRSPETRTAYRPGTFTRTTTTPTATRHTVRTDDDVADPANQRYIIIICTAIIIIIIIIYSVHDQSNQQQQ